MKTYTKTYGSKDMNELIDTIKYYVQIKKIITNIKDISFKNNVSTKRFFFNC